MISTPPRQLDVQTADPLRSLPHCVQPAVVCVFDQVCLLAFSLTSAETKGVRATSDIGNSYAKDMGRQSHLRSVTLTESGSRSVSHFHVWVLLQGTV